MIEVPVPGDGADVIAAGGQGNTQFDATSLPLVDQPTRATSPDDMVGEWKMVQCDNMEEYLKACGVEMEKNEIGPMGHCTIEISKLGEEGWKLISTSAAGRKGEIQFKLDGGEYDEQTWDGRKCKTNVSWNDGILSQERHCDGKPASVVKRTFRGDEMDVIATADFVSSRRRYKKFVGP